MADVFKGLDTSSRIRGILASRGKTQAELAHLLRITPETISSRMKSNKWEVAELLVIAEAYGLDTKDLL